MNETVTLLFHLLTTIVRLLGSGGTKAIVAMKQRNPRFGCPRIAEQINASFGLDIDKDIVRRVLAKHYRPDPRDQGPSWLTTLGLAKDSLWSIDLFRCDSILLKNHWRSPINR